MKNKPFVAEIMLLGLVLSLATWLRFANLRTYPDWFVDEGEFIRLANYLAHGNFDFMGIRNSALLIGRPPLFIWLLAGAFKLFGTDILVLRSLTAACGVLTVAVSYLIARQALSKTSAAYTAVLLAILPDVVFFNRLGFTYNWFALLTMLFLLGLWFYLNTGQILWLAAASLCAGAALASDYLGLVNIALLVLAVAIHRPKHLAAALLLGGLPWLAVVLPVFWHGPTEAWYDLLYVLGWGAGAGKASGSSLAYALFNLVQNYGEMAPDRTWIMLGLVGLAILPDQRLRICLLWLAGGFLGMFAFGRILDDHYLIALWPVIAIGLGHLLGRGVAFAFAEIKDAFQRLESFLGMGVAPIVRQLLGSLVSSLVVFAVFFTPMIWMLGTGVRAFVNAEAYARFYMPRPYFVRYYIPQAEVEAIAASINTKIKPNDLVLASGAVAWMIPVETVDFRTIAVYESSGEAMLRPGFDMQRFVRDLSLENMSYAVVDNFWEDWADGNLPIKKMLAEVSGWKLLEERAGTKLYCNPALCK